MFEPSHMQYTYDREKDGAGEPDLMGMVTKAISILERGKNGFLLLVEGTSQLNDSFGCPSSKFFFVEFKHRSS